MCWIGRFCYHLLRATLRKQLTMCVVNVVSCFVGFVVLSHSLLPNTRTLFVLTSSVGNNFRWQTQCRLYGTMLPFLPSVLPTSLNTLCVVSNAQSYLSSLVENGGKMDNHTLNEIYSTLSAVGVVDSKREFYKDWMNRSEGYVRWLKHSNKQPSADTLAICSSKLKHYSRLLTQKQNDKCVELASVFSDYSTKLDLIIFDNSKTKWMELMEDDSNKTIH